LPSTIQQLHRDYASRGLRIVAVNIQESYETADAWSRKEQIAFPIVLDREGTTAATYGVRSTPTVFLIGRDGKLLGATVGTKPWTSPAGRALLEALLVP